ncbi:MAG TPA: hypothetical protein VGE52_06880 [Pirellulales bacterium]
MDVSAAENVSAPGVAPPIVLPASIATADRDNVLALAVRVLHASPSDADAARYREQCIALAARLVKWTAEHRDSVQASYLIPRSQAWQFVVVQKQNEFDEPLWRAVAELNIEIARDPAFSLLRFDAEAVSPLSKSRLADDLALGAVRCADPV